MKVNRFTLDNRGKRYGIVYLQIDEAIDDYEAMFKKRQQLEREIREYTTGTAQANLIHSLEKLWMFSRDSFVPDEVQQMYHASVAEQP